MFVSILDGEDPRSAKPVLMTRDPVVLRALGDALSKRLEAGAAENQREVKEVLELVREGDDG